MSASLAGFLDVFDGFLDSGREIEPGGFGLENCYAGLGHGCGCDGDGDGDG